MEEVNKPKVGIGIMVMKNGKVLLGKRIYSHGAGEWQFPGGHLEYLESFEDCAIRETKEEVGLEITNIRFLFLANVKKYEPKHYVHIGLIADYKSGEPRALEREKSDNWNWYKLDNLPTPMFEMCRLSFEAYKTGKDYFDN